jgi:nicotinate-nucleotide adenylyltransferase
VVPAYNEAVGIAATLRLLHAAIDELGLERLLILVVADPGHKATHAPAEARLELARLAFADDARIDVELDAHPRTVDSLEALGRDDPVFVIGADELVDFHAWKRPERILELARLAVATRPGVPDVRVREAHARLPAPDRVSFFEFEPAPVSSTLVRERVARGEPVEDLVPAGVGEAVRRLGLYADAE